MLFRNDASSAWHEGRIVTGTFLWYGNRKAHAFVVSIGSQKLHTPIACIRGSATMKDTVMTPVPAGESAERENFANRKLIRPTLPRVENHGNHNSSPMPVQGRRERPERHDRSERTDRSDRPMG